MRISDWSSDVCSSDLIKPRRFEQDAARCAMLDGQVMPFSVIKRRVEREMDGANYLGSEFDNRRGEYRLKYMREGRVRLEEDTSELQSLISNPYAVSCLEKNKIPYTYFTNKAKSYDRYITASN